MTIRKFARVVCLLGAIFTLTACGQKTTDPTPKTITGPIDLVTRDEGSGTRAAFNEMLGITTNGIDNTTPAAIVQNGTDQVMTLVEEDAGAIGYISLGSLNSTVKAMKVDHVAPTEDNIVNGTYKLYRPFIIVTNKNKSLSAVAEDFINFILSRDGQQVVREGGYVPIQTDKSYQSQSLSGNINISGSTSVGPVMEKLAEAYERQNPQVTINITQNGSSAGIQAARQGSSDFGMSSRELTDSEQDVSETVIANDGIVVIASKANAADDISSEALKQIYLGNVKNWEDIKS
ncbi:MAG: extracellular solute-binding protein [Aerococcus sp.]|nr:extracellular solute-binding protein [Aerococcus sp.]